MYLFIKKMIPLWFKRKIVISFRAVKILTLLISRGVKCRLLIWWRLWGGALSSSLDKVRRFCLATVRKSKRDVSVCDVNINLDVPSRLIKDVVDSDHKKAATTDESVRLFGGGRRIFSIESVYNCNPHNVSLDEVLKTCADNTLIFVENNSCAGFYAELAKVLTVENITVVFRAKSDYLKFLATSEEVVAHAGVRVLYIEGIDPEKDELIYTDADESADIFLSFLKKHLVASGDFIGFAQCLQSLSVAISDRLVVWFRSYYFLSRFISARDVKRFYVVCNRVPSSRLIIPLLDKACLLGSGFLILDDRSFRGGAKVKDILLKSFGKIGVSRVSRYDFTRIPIRFSDFSLFVGNLKAPQYREAMIPIVNGLVSLGKKLVVIHPYSDEDGMWLDSDDVLLISPSVSIDLDPKIDAFNECFDCAVDDAICASGDNSVMLLMYVFLNARMGLHRVLRDAYRLMQDLDAVSLKGRVGSLVSVPGRLPISQLLVGYFDSIPSFEVQSGPWSKSRRFKAPSSKYILANDGYSKGIFVDYLGVCSERVFVVGSPRIDSKLLNIRSFSRDESRNYVLPNMQSKRILCVATQPYGLHLMEDMVSEVAKYIVSAGGEWVVLVSMHPNESHAHEKSYREILSDLIVSGCAFIRKSDIYHNLNSADAVVTYFSTSGMEAFCLDKPVFTFRSLAGHKVPFDLSELGVAMEFSTSLELAEGISQGFSFELDLDLQCLRDGRSISRICDAILGGSVLR